MLTTPRAPPSFVGYQPVLAGRFSENVKNHRIRFFEEKKLERKGTAGSG
jgi:hypothetical protein